MQWQQLTDAADWHAWLESAQAMLRRYFILAEDPPTA
jgi:hypothetical protein